MKRFLFFTALAVWLPVRSAPVWAESPQVGGLKRELLSTGTWETDKNLTTRSQMRLDMPASGLGFRLQLVDRRPVSSPELFAESFAGGAEKGALTALSGGVYHKPTDSRLLYGMLKTEGLAARIKNPWLRGAPFAENHTSSRSDLKTDVSATARPALFLYAGSPEWQFHPGEAAKLRGFTAVSLESTGKHGTTLEFSGGRPAFAAGTDFTFAKNGFTRLEFFYTEGTIPERKQSSWFSFAPALPERDFALWAGSLAFSVPSFGFAADGAWSETFAYGRDFYGNAGFRFGDRPWRFSLAVDGSGSRYTGPDGGENHAELRYAAKLERRGRRGSLLRFDALCRAGETDNTPDGGFLKLAETPNRTSLGFYYRFPQNHAPAALSRLSFKLSSDSRDTKKDSAGAEALAGLHLWRFDSDTQIKLSAVRNKAEESDYQFDSFRLRESLVWTKNFLQCKTALGCTIYAVKEPVWDASLSAALQAKCGKADGWFKIKLDSPRAPEDWRLTFSWLAKW
jgi:hypothetical protein